MGKVTISTVLGYKEYVVENIKNIRGEDEENSDFRIYPDYHKIYRGQTEIVLTKAEYELFMLLSGRPGVIFTKEKIFEMEKKEKRQKEGMEAKRLRGEWDEVGRPRAIEQEKFNQEFMRVVQKKVTPTQLQRELGLTSSTYYRYRKNFYEIFPEFLQSV